MAIILAKTKVRGSLQKKYPKLKVRGYISPQAFEALKYLQAL